MTKTQCRTWLCHAIEKIEQDFQRSGDTHLFKLQVPAFPGIDIYLKDESTHPTGSLKHRLARSLFLYGICNGKILENTAIIEASSGSTAISEAYFAKILNLPFITVMPRSTSEEKIAQIAYYGGRCHFVDDPHEIYSTAERLAEDLDGHYMDQFTFAEQATDWRGNNNVADSIFDQMKKERFPTPTWIVVSAGTGGTSATIGRYIRYRCLRTKLCVVDPEHSVFHAYYKSRDPHLKIQQPSLIEGIGRPRVEPSFQADVIDKMFTVKDSASLSAMKLLEDWLGKRCGGSTGTNLVGTLYLAQEMARVGQSGSIVTMICDGGDRYQRTYYSPEWLASKNLQLSDDDEVLSGTWSDLLAQEKYESLLRKDL